MRRWIRILSMAALAATLAVGTAAADDALEDFLVLGADPEDFRPVSEAASSESLFFVGGSMGTGPLDPFGDAAIVALDVRDGSEVWRASEGEADVPETFSVVGVAGGRVCAAGTLVTRPINRIPFVVERELLVACYRANRGERLWVRRIVLEPARGSLAPPLLHVSKRAVVVTLSTAFGFGGLVFGSETLVLRFDATDGTGR